MGTWGINTFENDGTSDWLWDLEESKDESVLVAALKPEDCEEYLEAPDGEIIIAACEIINGIANGPRDNLPDEALAWINANKGLEVSSLIPEAVAMLDRVLAENSELNELWAENETDYPVWKSGVEDLRRRLAGK